MQKRRLGRTGLQVSIVGFGGSWLSDVNKPDAEKTVRRAFDLGINYFDTAKLDGDSEEKIGGGLKNVRDECIIATKTGSRTKGESLTDIESSLKRLQTDRLDLIQLHGIDDSKTLAKAMGADGALESCKRARSRGLVDFIGISSHRPRVLVEAIKTGEFDTVLVPLNVVTRQALEELIPLAKELNVGVVIMKPFSVKTSNIITVFYKPSLSLLSDEPELKAMLGNNSDMMVRTALRFILSQDISAVIPGLRSVEEVEVAAKIGYEYEGLTANEKPGYQVDFENNYCRDCGLCLICPQSLNIPAILRFHMLTATYGLKTWGKKLYDGLEVKADECTKCGECEIKCPYKLPIMDLLDRVQTDFNP